MADSSNSTSARGRRVEGDVVLKATDLTWEIEDKHKIFATLKENPRKKNTKGWKVYNIILGCPDGITYEELNEAYAAVRTDNDKVRHHVLWDLNYKRLRVEDEEGNEVPGKEKPHSKRKVVEHKDKATDLTWKIEDKYKIFATLKENPRKKNTKGGEVYSIILGYPEGISYGKLKEIYAAVGTDKNDTVGGHVRWDLNRKRLRVEDEKGNEVPGKAKRRRKVVEPKDESKFSEQDNALNVKELIEGGEKRTVEFKSTGRKNLHSGKKDPEIEWALVKSICAFMNGAGGTLLVGVDDNGKAVGIEQDYPFVKHGNRDGWELWLTDIVSKRVGQVAVTDMDVCYPVIDGKTVACIDVKPGANPVFAETLKGEKREVFFARLNNSTRELTGRALFDYHKKRWPAQA